MNNNNIISKQTIVLETPPDGDKLKSFTMDQLINMCNNLQVPRELHESIVDDIKRKSFLISEILRINPPIPMNMNPVLLNSKLDETTMTKNNTFRYVKHILPDGKYKHTIITEESYKLPLTQRDIHIKKKEDLLNSIRNEISELNLDNYKNKEDILNFACKGIRSSGEKYRRAVILNNAVIEHNKGEKFIRPRITHYDISIH